MSLEDNSVIIEGLDLFDVVTAIDKKMGKFIALTLQEIETLNIKEEDYKLIRTFVLNGFNDFTRSTLRLLFGDVEIAPYKGHGK